MNNYVACGKIVFKTQHHEKHRGFILKRYQYEVRSQETTVDSINSFQDLCLSENEFMNQVGTKELKTMHLPFSAPKPEALLERIMSISTQPGDLVLDFFLGSGTTTAVAHKMGRQYIGIEQMDYVETVALERMKKVIAGEQGGISKKAGWQGGGEYRFIDMSDQVNITQS